jgi:hypothetical protein
MMLFQLQRLCGVEGGKAVVSDEYARIWKEVLISCLNVPSHCLLDILSIPWYAAIQSGSYKIMCSNYQ